MLLESQLETNKVSFFWSFSELDYVAESLIYYLCFTTLLWIISFSIVKGGIENSSLSPPDFDKNCGSEVEVITL